MTTMTVLGGGGGGGRGGGFCGVPADSHLFIDHTDIIIFRLLALEADSVVVFFVTRTTRHELHP